MTLKRFLTGKPGNVREFVEAAQAAGKTDINVTYVGWEQVAELGYNIAVGRIGYESADGKIRLAKDWDPKYGSVQDGRRKESFEESMKVQAASDLALMREAGLSVREIVDIKIPR